MWSLQATDSPAQTAAATQPSTPERSIAAQFDVVVKGALPADQPGGAVIVLKNDQVLYRKAYGMANLELGVPLQPDMVFRLGSITKQFTATATMLLLQDGKLALEDPIEKHLPGYLAKRLAAMAIGDPFPSPVAVKVDPKVLAGHVGVYEIDKSTRRTVTVENGKLYTQRSGQQRLEAIPSSETEFFLKVVDARITFVRGPGGKVDHLVLHQGGRDMAARRKD